MNQELKLSQGGTDDIIFDEDKLKDDLKHIGWLEVEETWLNIVVRFFGTK